MGRTINTADLHNVVLQRKKEYGKLAVVIDGIIEENAKCEKHFTIRENGLSKNWGGGTECFAIHHTAEKLVCGLRNATKKALKMTPLSLC